MLDLLTMALLIGFAIAAAAGFVLYQRQVQSTERDAFQALAARRGWALTISEQKLGRPAVLRLVSRSGQGWTAQVRRITESDSGTAPFQTTEYEAEEPSWSEGLLVIGRALPADTPDSVLAALDSPDGQKLLTRYVGDDVAKYRAVMRHYPSVLGIAIFATADPALRADFGDVAKLMAAWDTSSRPDARQPILILGPDSMRLRLRQGIRRADQMERFIDLALDLGRIL